MSDYEYDGSSCAYKPTPSTYSTNTFSCPKNSNQSPTDSSKCQCNTGYQVDSTKTSCIKITEVQYAQPSQTTPIDPYANLTSDERCVKLNLGTFFNTDKQNCDSCPMDMTRVVGTNICQKPVLPIVKPVNVRKQKTQVQATSSIKMEAKVAPTSQATTSSVKKDSPAKKSSTFWQKVMLPLNFWSKIF
jgi:hypothetical protein